MMRITLEGMALFLLPFAAYAVVMVARSRFGVSRRGPVGHSTIALAACGIGLVVLTLVALGAFGDRAKGVYVPAHLDHGRLVPGQLR